MYVIQYIIDLCYELASDLTTSSRPLTAEPAVAQSGYDFSDFVYVMKDPVRSTGHEGKR